MSKTIGETYGPAMLIETQEKADEYFNQLVAECVEKFNKTPEEAAIIQRSNLGYYAGYYDDETRRRVERLFRCVHPIFGGIADNGAPSPENAFALGVAAGKGSMVIVPQPKTKPKKADKTRVFRL